MTYNRQDEGFTDKITFQRNYSEAKAAFGIKTAVFTAQIFDTIMVNNNFKRSEKNEAILQKD